MGLYSGLSLPNSEYLYKKGLYLPSGLALTEDQILKSSQALINVINEV
jgi:perosamine synthetase